MYTFFIHSLNISRMHKLLSQHHVYTVKGQQLYVLCKLKRRAINQLQMVKKEEEIRKETGSILIIVYLRSPTHDKDSPNWN
jgi:hypothetical protein